MTDDTFIQFKASQEDKRLLALIARADGDTGMSATMRRLIRNEAKQRGIEIPDQSEVVVSLVAG